MVDELDGPALVAPSMVGGLPRLASPVMGWLGFRYLLLHRFAEAPGTLAAEPEFNKASASTLVPA